jgi:PAS domain S-box-containing protein
VILVCLVAVLSFIAPKLAAALLLNPQTVWPLWPGCALLVSVLVLEPRRIWPIIVPAAFAGFALYDVLAGVPASSIAWFILADTVQVLAAALCLRYFFDGVPRLNSVKAVGKYAFFAVLLAPSAGAFLSAFGIHGDYWSSWRISFFSEALAFVTLTPAILSWVRNAPEWARKSRAHHLEFAALITGLVILSYFTFTASENSASPLLFYSGVPFLLWAALRFGSRGVSSAVIVVSFLAIWGVVHDRGPFINAGPLSGMLALQLFLILAAAPFIVLAALVEERKQAEHKLRESQDRLAGIVGSAMDAIIAVDEEQHVVLFNTAAEKMFGCPQSEAVGTAIGHFIPQRFHSEHGAHLRTFGEPNISTRPIGTPGPLWAVRTNGQEFPIEASISNLESDGRKLFTIIIRDITERRQAEKALADVRRRLVEAHEEERTWIARELHDDINQRIALLTVQLEQWAQHPPSSAVEVTDHIRHVRQHLSDLGKDIQALSHRLHSSKLEYLGLVSAANGFCRELSEQQKVEIEFSHAGMPHGLPKETSLCLFRVLQEALQNAVKHSGGRLFSVELRGTSREIQLTVRDSGVGFDQQDATDRRGIGLVSMRERMQLVGGEFSIESKPGGGTTVCARVPFMVEEHRAATAG